MKFAFILLSLYSLCLKADIGCGEFRINAYVANLNNSYQLIINQNSKTETILVIPEVLNSKIKPYSKKNIKAEIVLTKPIVNKKGEIYDIKNIKNDIENPLRNALSYRFRILKASSCSN